MLAENQVARFSSVNKMINIYGFGVVGVEKTETSLVIRAPIVFVYNRIPTWQSHYIDIIHRGHIFCSGMETIIIYKVSYIGSIQTDDELLTRDTMNSNQ